MQRGDSARLALGFRSDSSATTVPLYNIKMLDNLFLGGLATTRAMERGSLEFYHALVLLLVNSVAGHSLTSQKTSMVKF